MGYHGSRKTTLLQALALKLTGTLVARSLLSDLSEWVSLGTPSGIASVHINQDTRREYSSNPG